MAGVSQAQSTENICVKNGQKIAFLGDSITAQGNSSPSGYVRLVVSALEANGIKVGSIGAGISGHKSNDMLARLDRDVIEKKPDWMTLSCGVNDVWHGDRGVPLDKYKENITQIVDKAQAAKIGVIILTATVINEDIGNANNEKLKDYNAFLKTLAAEKKCALADLNGDLQVALEQGEKAGKKRGNMLTRDGVHMNPHGDMIMATGVLKAMGLNEAQLTKAREFWLDIPKSCSVTPSISLRDFLLLDEIAAKEGSNAKDVSDALLAKAIQEKAKTLGDAPATPPKNK